MGLLAGEKCSLQFYFLRLPVAFERVNRVNVVFWQEKYSISQRRYDALWELNSTLQIKTIDYELLVLQGEIQE